MNRSLPISNPAANLAVAVLLEILTSTFNGAAAAAAAKAPFVPPALPDGQTIVRDQTNAFLRATPTLRTDVTIAKTPPVIEMMFYPGQTYAGNRWSCWGDGVAVAGKYYSAIGDHLAPGGNAFVFEYDDTTRALRRVVDARETLALPAGRYTPDRRRASG
jgi:hypothetical protein